MAIRGCELLEKFLLRSINNSILLESDWLLNTCKENQKRKRTAIMAESRPLVAGFFCFYMFLSYKLLA